MLRNLLLKAADRPALVKLFSGLGKRSGLADRFVAGETLDTALQAVRQINQLDILASLDLLGEGVTDPEAAKRAAGAYIELLTAIAESGVRSNISIKLTQLGLEVSRDLCAKNLQRILDKARQLNNFVRIDMEGSEHTQDTLDLFESAFPIYGFRHVGIVIQAYLRRSEEDIRRLVESGCNIRLCKGAYQEPPEIAFQRRSKVDANFIKLLEIMLQSPAYTAIASHDHRMVEHARRFVAEKQIPIDRYEFQMLYGVRRDYQLQLRRQGYRFRVYVPFGTEWAPYFMRRLAERPANLLFTLRAIVKK